MEQVVIAGGGIAGSRRAPTIWPKAGAAYTLIEKLPRVGGVIQTTLRDGCVIEGGPDSFISQKPEALALIKELGLESEVIGSNDAHARHLHFAPRQAGALAGGLPDDRADAGVAAGEVAASWAGAPSSRMGLELLRAAGDSSRPLRGGFRDRSFRERDAGLYRRAAAFRACMAAIRAR